MPSDADRKDAVSPRDPQLLSVRAFDSRDSVGYARFDAIRQEVFGRELQWPLPASGGAGLIDRFDGVADLWIADTDSGAVGIVRAIRVSRGFPHRDLFERHMEPGRLDLPLTEIGTINALAVLPPFRRELFRNTGGMVDTASALLLAAALAGLRDRGVRLVLATVLSAISARTFLRAGFRILDPPQVASGHAGFRLANVALVMTAEGQSLAEYVSRCHDALVGTRSIEELFGEPPVQSPAPARIL